MTTLSDITNQDTITINHLEIMTLIGTYAFERRLPQKLFITLQFAIGAAHIANSDDIEISRAIDYDKLSQALVQFGLDSEFFLLETFGEKLSAMLLTQHSLSWLKLSITKPAALKNAQGVTLTLERTHA